jgi:hypothetical protein
MCLPHQPYKIEREWIHAGLRCVVTQAWEAQHRCGYVRVPPGHPVHGHEAEDLGNVQVHGGINFAEIEPCTEHEDGQGWWFGFHCGHAWDLRYDPNVDLERLSPSTRETFEYMGKHLPTILRGFGGEHYWTEDEVAAECDGLADQLAEIAA